MFSSFPLPEDPSSYCDESNYEAADYVGASPVVMIWESVTPREVGMGVTWHWLMSLLLPRHF
jgi:hypothetical protein